MPTALAVELHFCFLLLLYPPYTVPDVTSSSILSMTVAAPLSPMTSFAAIPMTVATSSRLASSSNRMSSQLPPANGGDVPSGSGTGTVIGVVVAVVIVLVVGSVIVAALLIAWKVRSRGKKGFTGKYSDGM